MPGAKRQCSNCQKTMRSDNLRKHKKICKERKGSQSQDLNKEVSEANSAQQPLELSKKSVISEIINQILNKDTTSPPAKKRKKTLMMDSTKKE